MAAHLKAVIVPGNGGGKTGVRDANWYGWLEDRLSAEPGLFPGGVILRDMPDPYVARETYWIPFLLDELGVGEDTVLIGHSSGAEAAMRLVEEHRLAGVVLVCACHTDLGEESERAAGYYSRPWRWERQKENTPWILQYHSRDDPFIPVDEARHVHANNGSEYHEFADRSHFFRPSDVEVVGLYA